MSLLRLKRLMRISLNGFPKNRDGLAAVEFALIVPLMLLIFFGMVETTNGIAIDRKVSVTARTLSDLISQAATVTDDDIANSFLASSAILIPYSSEPVEAKISQIIIDKDKNAKIVWSKGWSKGAMTTGRASGPVTLPSKLEALKVPNTYLIWGEVQYLYLPNVPYLNKEGILLSDQSFSRPRQSVCVIYKTYKCT